MEVFKEKDFKWRGGNVSRLESIVDAVFAIAVTLLIVSRDIPSDFDEFMNVMLSFVGFIFTFTFLFMIWYAHYLFHRRFGLEDFKTSVSKLSSVTLTVAIINIVYLILFVIQCVKKYFFN